MSYRISRPSPRTSLPWTLQTGAALLAVCVTAAALAEEPRPLHETIDRLVEQAAAEQSGGPLSPLASDAEFLRRATLDFAGRIPTRAEFAAFREDDSAHKRSRLIDRLLAADEYATRMTNAFDIMLMERRGEEPEWNRFLLESFRENRPWDQMVRDIVAPGVDNENTRGAAYFYTKRLEKYGQNPVDYPGLVRDVGRMFLGVDVQCAQCHDHLFVDDYKQVDFQGLFAFFEGLSIRRDTKFPAVVEKPLLAKIEFQSVFETGTMSTGPRLPFGEELAFPVFKKGEEYEVPPDRKTKSPGVLKFSPLKALGEELPRADNRLFAVNFANRMWWLLMGRGLVEPLDLQHADNPASHPELLDKLADDAIAHDFDIKHMLRQIAISRTYQRSSQLPPEATDEPSLASHRTAIERPLSAEQVLASVKTALQLAEPNDNEEAATDLASLEAAEKNDEELLKRFRAALANPPREPELSVNPTVKAALFFMHDPGFLRLFEPRDGNLVEQLAKTESVDSAAETMFIAILSREPTSQELEMTKRYLEEAGDEKANAWSQMAWALVASTEFLVNH